MKLLSRPWFLAVLALFLMLGTQIVALKLHWEQLLPEPPTAHVVVRDEPAAFTWGFSSEAIDLLKNELSSRIVSIEEREAALVEYDARLKSDRAEIEDIKRQVEIMRASLLEDIVRLEEEEKTNLKTLAKTYSTLTPAATVSIFQELDDSTVVKILFFMKADVVGQVLEQMATPNGGAQQVKRAARLSDMLRLFNENPQTAS